MTEKVSTFAARLREGLTIRNMTQAELARRTGLDKSSISRDLKNEYRGNQDAVYSIAHSLNVNEAWLMGYDVPMEREATATGDSKPSLPPGAMPIVPGNPIPILGSVRCGLPMYADSNILGYVPYLGVKGEEYFALQATGDSMNAAGIQDGDTLIVRKQDYVDPGTIAVVCVNGDEATVKRFRQDGNTVLLSPLSTNPEHQVQVYDISKIPVHIMGRVMEVRHTI